MSNEIENTTAFKIASALVKRERERQNEALHREPARNSQEIHSGIAFNLGFDSTKEMDDQIEKNPRVFTEISKLAVKKIVSYGEAEAELRKVLDPKLSLKIKKYQNSKKRHEYEPRPESALYNPHKPYPKMTKGRLESMAKAWFKWGKPSQIINTEKATPLDETPAFTLFEDKD